MQLVLVLSWGFALLATGYCMQFNRNPPMQGPGGYKKQYPGPIVYIPPERLIYSLKPEQQTFQKLYGGQQDGKSYGSKKYSFQDSDNVPHKSRTYDAFKPQKSKYTEMKRYGSPPTLNPNTRTNSYESPKTNQMTYKKPEMQANYGNTYGDNSMKQAKSYEGEVCKHGTLRGMSSDRESFEICDNDAWVAMPCAPGTWFDNNIGECTNGYGVQKYGTKSMSAEQDQVKKTDSSFRRFAHQKSYSSTQNSQVCQPGRLRAVANNRDQYEICDNDSWVPMPCAPGTWFEEDLQKCTTGDDPWPTDNDAWMKPNPNPWTLSVPAADPWRGANAHLTCALGLTRMNSGSGRSYEECGYNVAGGTVWIERSCAPGTTFDAYSSTCGFIDSQYRPQVTAGGYGATSAASGYGGSSVGTSSYGATSSSSGYDGTSGNGDTSSGYGGSSSGTSSYGATSSSSAYGGTSSYGSTSSGYGGSSSGTSSYGAPSPSSGYGGSSSSSSQGSYSSSSGNSGMGYGSARSSASRYGGSGMLH